MTTYIGTVTWYNKRKGYGFVKCNGKLEEESILMSEKDCPNVNNQYFVHVSDIQTSKDVYKKLIENEVIYFSIETDSVGKTKCVNVRGFNGGSLVCEHKTRVIQNNSENTQENSNEEVSNTSTSS